MRLPSTILLDHHAPLWAVAALVVVAAGLAVLSWRRSRLAGAVGATALALRLAFFALAAACLLMPVARHTVAERTNPRLVIVVDQSASMALTPASGAASRWRTAAALLRHGWVESAADRYDVVVHGLAEDVGEPVLLADLLASTPHGRGTRLREGLARLVTRYKGQPLAGFVLLSDGLDTQELAADWTAGPWPAPVLTARLEPAGTWTPRPNVRVEVADTPARAVLNWDTRLTAVISAGQVAEGAVPVELWQDRQKLGEQRLDLRGDTAIREAVFDLHHPQTGTFTYAVRVPPLAGEADTADNEYAVTVTVDVNRNHVVYIETVPRWESKYLVRALSDNPGLAPLAFLRGADGQFLAFGQAGGAGLALTPEQLDACRIIILGDLAAADLGPERAERIVRFVENGGSLVLLGAARMWEGDKGLESTALERLLPVRFERRLRLRQGHFPVALTAVGREHPLVSVSGGAPPAFPPLLSAYQGGQATAGAEVVLEAASDSGSLPVVVTQRYGQGKVVAILTDSLWKWKLAAGSQTPYDWFCERLIAWLVPETREPAACELQLFVAGQRVSVGQPVTLKARLGSAGRPSGPAPAVTCELRTPDDRTMSFTMAATTDAAGQAGYALDVQPQAPGLHQAVASTTVAGAAVTSPVCSFFAQAVVSETQPRPADVRLLEALARASGGAFCESAADLGAAVGRLSAKAEERVSVRHRRLWNAWPVLAGLLGLLIAEWSLRRWRGLP